MFDRWNRCLNTGIVRDLAIFQWDVKINAHKHFFGGNIQIADGQLGHGAGDALAVPSCQDWDQHSSLHSFLYSKRDYPVIVFQLMISLVIIVTTAPGKAEEFQKYITEEAADVIANEPCCSQFIVSRSRENSSIFTLAEFYDDQAALDAHRLTPHFVLFQERVREYGLISEKYPVAGDVVFP